MTDNNPKSGISSKVPTLRLIFFALQAGQIIFLAIASFIAYSGKLRIIQESKIQYFVLLASIGINLAGSAVFYFLFRRIVISKKPSEQQLQTAVFTILLIAMGLTESSGLLSGINIIMGNSL